MNKVNRYIVLLYDMIWRMVHDAYTFYFYMRLERIEFKKNRDCLHKIEKKVKEQMSKLIQ